MSTWFSVFVPEFIFCLWLRRLCQRGIEISEVLGDLVAGESLSGVRFWRFSSSLWWWGVNLGSSRVMVASRRGGGGWTFASKFRRPAKIAFFHL